jgi:hypothetical protein
MVGVGNWRPLLICCIDDSWVLYDHFCYLDTIWDWEFGVYLLLLNMTEICLSKYRTNTSISVSVK